MNKTTELVIPDFSKKEEKPKKGRPPSPPKTVEKEVLPRTNREVKCAYCEATKILNPDQYQKRFDYFGSDDAVARHFQCQDCETAENTNPFRFWFTHSPIVNNMALRLKPVFETYVMEPNPQRLQDDTHTIMIENGIRPPNYAFVIENGLPEGLTINFPFVGVVTIRPKEFRMEKKIVIDNR